MCLALLETPRRGTSHVITDFGLLLQSQNRARFWSFDLGHWQCKNWPCSYLQRACLKRYFLKVLQRVSLCIALLVLKAWPQAGQGKMKISVHLLRSPCVTWTWRMKEIVVVLRRKLFLWYKCNLKACHISLLYSTVCLIIL